MAKKPAERGLGKGLGALWGEEAVRTLETSSSTLPVSQIEANDKQPRKSFENSSLDDLAESISLHGVLQPILVRQLASGYYQIISGERRWRAARMAGLSEIPATIIEADDKKAMELGLIENLQREDLNPIEEALGYQALLTEYGMTQEEISQQVGKSRPAIANALRLIHLTPEVKDMVADGDLSSGHARALVGLERDLQIQLAQRIVADGLSVRQTEELVKRLSKPKKQETAQSDPNEIYIRAVEKDLGTRLGRKIRIVDGKKKGKLELEYYGIDDLNDLLDALETLPLSGKQEKPL